MTCCSSCYDAFALLLPFDSLDSPFDILVSPFDLLDSPFEILVSPFDLFDSPFEIGQIPILNMQMRNEKVTINTRLEGRNEKSDDKRTIKV